MLQKPVSKDYDCIYYASDIPTDLPAPEQVLINADWACEAVLPEQRLAMAD